MAEEEKRIFNRNPYQIEKIGPPWVRRAYGRIFQVHSPF